MYDVVVVDVSRTIWILLLVREEKKKKFDRFATRRAFYFSSLIDYSSGITQGERESSILTDWDPAEGSQE